MTDSFDEALASLRVMLEADGYDLTLRETAEGLIAEIRAGADACADCLVQKDLMRIYLENALRPALGPGLPPIAIHYPADLV